MRFLIRWFINILALLVVIHVIAGVSIDSMQTVLAAALILGLLNAFIRPFILIATLPFTILTFGLFTLFINGALFYLAAKFVKGFTVASFWDAFWAALLFSVISSSLNFVFSPKLDIRVGSFRPMGRDRDDAGKGDYIDVDSNIKS